MKTSYDVIVIGAGPAGSTVAALLAEAGIDALLIEREAMPRFHVGESLMPESYWPLKRLGVLDQMKKSHHPQKKSVQFISHTGKESAPFFFFNHDPRESSQTWQVVRSEFDQMLFENARQKGADCHDQTRVQEVLFEGERATGVRVAGQNSQPSREIGAKVIVDATGQQTIIASQLGLRKYDPELRKTAIWGYYQGARREQGDHSGATIIMRTKNKESWFWFIPLADDLTSIGVVGDSDYLLKGRGAVESIFEEELVLAPAVVERLVDSQLVSKFHVAKEFSYHTTQSCGEGWVLIGDAFGFIDPIYSSGVYFALVSGEKAADCIISAWGEGDVSAEKLGAWIEGFQSGSHWVRKLIDAFYDDAFSFGKFLKAYPHHASSLTDILIGRIFHPQAGDMFRDLDVWLAEARKTSSITK